MIRIKGAQLRSLSHYTAALAFATFSIAFGLLTRLAWPPVFDEGIYHLPLLPKFVPWPSLDVLHSYNTAVGPFFYLLYGNLGAAFSYSLPALRAISIVVGVATLVALGRTSKQLELSRSTAAFLLVTPYFITLSVLLMSDILALGLFVISLGLIVAALKSDILEILPWLALVCAMTAAEYTRQYYVLLPIALVVFAAFKSVRGESSLKLFAAGLVSLALFAPLVIFWRGLVPDEPSVRSVQRLGIGLVTLSNLNLLLVWTPLFLGPILIGLGRWRLLLHRWTALTPVLAVPICVLAPPLAFGRDRLAGFYSSVLIFLHIPSIVETLMMFVLWWVGVMIVVAIVRTVVALRRRYVWFLLLVGALIGVVLMFSAGRLTERYFLPAVPVAALMFALPAVQSERAAPTLAFVSLSVQALVSGLYLYNKLTGHFG